MTLTDLFAGAGGSSTGAIRVPGVEVIVAANHWRKAIEVHNANHPEALHICADVSQVNPRHFPRTDILWASPECTNHSIAKGQRRAGQQPDLFGETLPDEAAERSRATMWDVPRFAETHRYQAVIVENVVDVRHWAPYTAWLAAMTSLGYEHQEVFLNSAYAQAGGPPAPQSRDRIYVVFWRHGNRRPDLVKWTSPKAWCPHCQEIIAARQTWKRPERPYGRYRAQYTYACPDCWTTVEPGWLPAAAAIDWSLPGERIADRKRPLADKTRRRIAAGIARYWRPFVVDTTRMYDGHAARRTYPLDSPLPTQTTQSAHALITEAAGNTYDATSPRHPQHGDPNAYHRVWPIDEPLRTLHATESKAVVTPFVLDNNHSNRARPVDDVLPTQTTATTKALVAPYYGRSAAAKPVGDPLGTLTTLDKFGLVLRSYGTSPRGGSDKSLVTPLEEPLRTLVASRPPALITRHYSQRTDDDLAYLSTPATEALRTLTTTAQQSIVTPADIEVAEAQVDDCLFRMLEPHEVAAGMAFPSEYIWHGTRRERVKMAGNAVTPPAARDLIHAVVEALA